MAAGDPNVLLADVRDMILSARQTVARGANAALVALYWKVGQRIRNEILRDKWAEFGQEIVVTLSRQLAVEFGSGFGDKNLRRMVQFAEGFPEERIVAALSRQLGWSHFVALIPLKKHLQRDFYAEMCRIERWSVRTLRRKIAGMLYERTALSKKPAELAEMELKQLREEDKLTPDLVFGDPASCDFIGLKGLTPPPARHLSGRHGQPKRHLSLFLLVPWRLLQSGNLPFESQHLFFPFGRLQFPRVAQLLCDQF